MDTIEGVVASHAIDFQADAHICYSQALAALQRKFGLVPQLICYPERQFISVPLVSDAALQRPK